MERALRMLHLLRRDRSGQALVEAAVLTPIFVLVLFGAIDFGRFAYDGILLANAARAGVQYGTQTIATAQDSFGIQTAAMAEASGLTISTPTVTTSCSCADGTSVNCDTVTVCAGSHRLTFVQIVTTGTFNPLIAYPGLPGTLTITRTAKMQVSP